MNMGRTEDINVTSIHAPVEQTATKLDDQQA